MPTRTQQLRQSVLFVGLGTAFALVVSLALVARQTARRTLEEQARQRGVEVATRVGNLAGAYIRERRREAELLAANPLLDRKSTRLNSSHSQISYAVFCLKKKNPLRNCHVYIIGAVTRIRC